VTITIGRGEFFSMLGPSGCGKTTSLRMIAGFEEPDAGRVELTGRDIVGVAPYKRNVNTVFQSYALFPHLTVADNVAFGLRRKKVAKSDIRSRVKRYLELVQLRGYDDRRPSQLSGGQQQRVALARALVNEPAVLLLDEPSARLDLGGREQLVQALAELTTDPSAPPLILVTHHLDEVPQGMTDVLMLRDGNVVAKGPIGRALTSTSLSDCFNMPLTLERRDDGRFNAWSPRAAAAAPDPT
jgi:spermidine/putrescine transport system ATP-binding protein